MANITSGVYLDPFILSEAELLEIYKKATEHIRNGKMMLQYQGEGTEARILPGKLATP